MLRGVVWDLALAVLFGAAPFAAACLGATTFAGSAAAAAVPLMLLLGVAAGMSAMSLLAAAALKLLSAAEAALQLLPAAVAAILAMLPVAAGAGDAAAVGAAWPVMPSVQCLCLSVSGQVVALLVVVASAAGTLHGSIITSDRQQSSEDSNYQPEVSTGTNVVSMLLGIATHVPGTQG
jgi:hypothetical protein